MRNLSTNSNENLERNKSLRKFCMIALSTSAIIAMHSGMAMATPFSSWTVVVNNNDTVQDSTATFFSYNAPSINDEGVVVFRARAMIPHGSDNQDGAIDETPETAVVSSASSEATSADGHSGGGGGTGQGQHSGESGHGDGCGMEIGKQPSGGSEDEMIHGIFTRDALITDSPIISIATRGDKVPAPNNMQGKQAGTFNSFPSFPRIDAASDILAFRAQSKPSYKYAEETSGTSGLYFDTADGNNLATAIRNIEPSAGFAQYFVPGQTDIRFEQFPGSPSVTGNLITFKGNWTDPTKDEDQQGRTGVYYRDLADDATDEAAKVVMKIAERGDEIPGPALLGGKQEENNLILFGSTAPPSAAAGKVVFTGLDNEDSPTAGGIFMANLEPNASLTTVAGFNTVVPYQETRPTLNTFGEALSFDGRYVGFWAGWGTDVFTKTVWCTSDGNSALTGACMEGSIGDQNGGYTGKYEIDVIKNQGIFLADTQQNELFLVAQTGDLFDDFLFWNYSGNPGKGEGARWRSSAFLAVDGNDIIFKALSTSGETGLYGAFNVSDQFKYDDILTILETGMSGSLIDPDGADMTITALSIERDGFRNGRFAIAAGMEYHEASMAGIYTATAPVPEPGTMTLFAVGIGGVAFWQRRKVRTITDK